MSDETDYIQVGQYVAHDFVNYDTSRSLFAELSSWDTFPTDDNPETFYKFFSVHLQLSKSLNNFTRETYSFLDWLGDCGGLYEGLFLLGSIFVSPVSEWALNSRLASTIVRVNPTTNIEVESDLFLSKSTRRKKGNPF